MQNRIILISVIAHRLDKLQEKVDAGVSGEYEIVIPLAEGSGYNLPDVALESFHNSIAIASPEDFEIQVFDQATGAELTPEYAVVETLFECKKIG
jgi:hypothetical protein